MACGGELQTLASQPAFTPDGDQAPDFADLKREAAGLIAQYGPALEELAAADSGAYLDGRRAVVLATAMERLTAALARAAHCEEVREAVTSRTPPPRQDRSRRMLRLLHVAAFSGGLAGAAAVGAEILINGGIS